MNMQRTRTGFMPDFELAQQMASQCARMPATGFLAEIEAVRRKYAQPVYNRPTGGFTDDQKAIWGITHGRRIHA